MAAITEKRRQLLERVASLPEELLDEIDETVAEIVDLSSGRVVHATPEELEGIDRGLKAAREDRVATDAEVKEVLASFRTP